MIPEKLKVYYIVLIQLLSFVTVYKDSMKVLQGSTRVRVVRQGRGLGAWYKHGIIHPGKEVLFAKVVGGSVELYTLCKCFEPNSVYKDTAPRRSTPCAI